MYTLVRLKNITRNKLVLVLCLTLSFCYSGAQELSTIAFRDSIIKSNNNAQISALSYFGEKRSLFYYQVINAKDTIMVPSSKVYYTDVALMDVPREGYIRFVDSNTNLVGLLSSQGKVALEAVYKDLGPVRNSTLMALNDDIQKTYDKQIDSIINKPEFFNGLSIDLISPNGKVLVKDFNYTPDIDFYTLELLKEPKNDPFYIVYPAADGYYHFINKTKVFEKYFFEVFLPGFNSREYRSVVCEKLKGYFVGQDFLEQEFVSFDYQDLEDSSLVYLEQLLQEVQHDQVSDVPSHRYTIVMNSLDNVLGKIDISMFENTWYLDENQQWNIELYDLFQVTITQVENNQVRKSTLVFFRDNDNSFKLVEVDLNQKWQTL